MFGTYADMFAQKKKRHNSTNKERLKRLLKVYISLCIYKLYLSLSLFIYIKRDLKFYQVGTSADMVGAYWEIRGA